LVLLSASRFSLPQAHRGALPAPPLSTHPGSSPHPSPSAQPALLRSSLKLSSMAAGARWLALKLLTCARRQPASSLARKALCFSLLCQRCSPSVAHLPWPAWRSCSASSFYARTVPAHLLPAGHLLFAGARPARSSSSSHGGARLFLSADRAAHLPTSLLPPGACAFVPVAPGSSPSPAPLSPCSDLVKPA
jgi:hypothetical protein